MYIEITVPGKKPQQIECLSIDEVSLAPGPRPQRATFLLSGTLVQQNHGITELDCIFSMTAKGNKEDNRYLLKATECRVEGIIIRVDAMDVLVEITGKVEI